MLAQKQAVSPVNIIPPVCFQLGEYAMGNQTKVSVIGIQGADMAMNVRKRTFIFKSYCKKIALDFA